MRRISFWAVTAVTAFIFSALGASMHSATAAPVTYNWAGFYFGGNAGVGWSNSAINLTGNDPSAIGILAGTNVAGGTAASPISINRNGVTMGVQAGYNFLSSPRLLVGIEADISLSNISGKGTTSNLIFPAQGGLPDIVLTHKAEQNIDWWGTVRGRLGFLARNELLLFATGGFAYAHLHHRADTFGGANTIAIGPAPFGVTCSTNSLCMTGASSRVVTGWSAGGGAEWALDSKFKLKLDYLYVNLGSSNANVVALQAAPAAPIPTSYTANSGRVDFHTVRLGLNLQFGGPAR